MGKKLLSILFISFLFFLNPFDGFGQCPSSVSISADPGKTICEGTNVIFTANPTGGEALQFQWQINGSNVNGATNQTFSTTGLTNGQKVRVVVTTGTENDTCSISSSEITMTVNSLKTPTVSIAAHENSLCAGDNISFSANNTNGGSNPQYEWFINNSSTPLKTGVSVDFSSSDFNEGDNYVRVRLTSSLECVTSETAEETSSTFTLKPDATISAPGNVNETTCINSSLNPINFNIGGGGTGATASGLPPGISGSFNAGTYTLSGTPTSVGKFNYTVTTTGTCTQTSATGTITVNPDATLSLSSGNANQTVCAAGGVADGNIEPISYAVDETGTGAEVTGLPEGISGSFSNGIFTISGASSETGTHNFSVTATGTCGNSSALTGAITITENSPPSVSISSSDVDNEICEGASVTFTASPTNGGSSPDYQWQVNGNNAGSNSNTFTTTSLADGQTITVIMTSNETCITENTATSNGISTKVNPNLEPSVSIDASDTEFCAGEEVTYTAIPVNGGTSPTYEWKVGSTIVGSGEIFTSSDLTDGQSVTVTLTSNETCVTTSTAVSDQVVTIVNENLMPSLSIESNDDNNIICSGSNITFTATPINGGTNPEYQWEVNGNASGAVTTSNTFSSADLNNGDIVSAVLISNEECLAENNVVSNEIPIQVDSSISGETPVWDNSVTSYNPTAICPSVSGLIYKVAPVPGATSYDWTLPSGWTITNGEGTNEITVTASVNASGGDVIVKGRTECGVSLQNSTTVTTGTAAHVDAGPDQTVCPGTSQITLAGEIGGVITQHKDWDWFASINGGSFTSDGFSNGGNALDGTYSIPTSVQSGGTVTIRIESVKPAGECAIKTDEMTITIESAATISDASNKDQTVCIDSAIEDISFTIGGVGKGAEVTGLPAGITGNFAEGIYTLSGTPTEAGTFNYTVTTTGDCENDFTSGSLTVNGRPTFTKPADVFVCSGVETSIISFEEGSISGTTYEWTNDNNSIGLAESGTGNINSFTAINNSTEPVIANISVTPIANNCEGTPEEFRITVYPTATFTTPENLVVCNGESLQDIVFAGSTVDGSTYKWTNSNTAIGLAAEGTGNISSFTATNSTNEPANATITVIPVANGCEGKPEEFTITVNPTPAFSAPENQIICNGEVFPEIVFSGETVAGTSFNWTNDNTAIGLAESGSGNLPAFTAVNNGNEPIKAIITVIPKANQCEGEPMTFEIIVNPTSTINPIEDVVVCNGEDLAEFAFTSAVSGTSFSWTNSNPAIGLAESGTGNLPVFSAENNTELAITAIITVIPTANECEGSPLTFDITVNSSATIDAGPDQIICSNSTATMAAILGGSATGGTWTTSGSGSFSDNTVNSIYTPSGMDTANGSVTLTYTSNDPDGPCDYVSDSLELIINEEVVITTQPENIGICSTEPSELSVIASGDNLTYEWRRTDNTDITNATGINSPTLSFNNTTSTNSGEYYVIISGEDACEEKISDTVTINVDENIIIEEPITEVPICGDGFSEVSMKFIAHANGAPLSFTWYKDNVEVDAALDENITITTQPADENGRYEGTLEIVNVTTNYNGDYYVEIQGPEDFTCSTAVTNPFQLRLNEVPEPPTVENFEYCQFEVASALTVISGENLTWYATETGNDAFNETPVPNTDLTGETIYWVTQTPDVCESERVAVSVNIKERPAAPETNILIEYCEGETANAIEAVPNGEATLNWYGADENLLTQAPTPNTETAGTFLYYVSQSLANCESEKVPIEVIIHAIPEVTITPSDTLVCSASSVILTAEGADTYIWYNEAKEEIGSTATLEVNPEITSVYSVVGTGTGECSTTVDITIEVDQPSDAGTISEATSVCIGNNTGEVSVSEINGVVNRWEFTEDNGATWETILLEESQISASYTYQNLTTTTGFRAVVQNGVCEEAISEIVYIQVDEYPIGGELNFEGFDRLYTTCENPEFLEDLILSGHTGQVVAWKYRTASQATFQTIAGETGNILSSATIAALVDNETLIFQAEVTNGACNNPVVSRTAILSVISSNIEPAPVSVSDDLICLGNQVTLSAETGYESGDGVDDSGNFDNASINQNGWRIINSNGVEENFETSANNTAPNVWRRVTPREFITADLSSPYNTSNRLFDHGLNNENKGFALVSGNNTSTMETNVFALDGMDSGILTFDQAYNLTDGASIEVLISTNGGNTYTPLYSNNNDPSSGNYTDFASGTPISRPENKIEIDLGDYIGQNNLRIMFSFVGARQGDVWAVDNIIMPDGPQNVGMVWEDTTDPDTPVIIGTNNSEPWTPTEIGWNVSVITTTLEYSGGSCPTATNNEEIRVFVYDQYTSTVQADTGSCGNYSTQLNATVISEAQGEITSYPTLDGYIGKWVVEGPEDYMFSNIDPADESNPINNPNAIFTSTAGSSGSYNINWVLEPTETDDYGNLIENEACLPIYEPIEVVFEECIALDFDGVDDYVDLGETYSGNYSIEAWIRPEASTGTIISGPNFEINMENLPAGVNANSRWYHIAVSNNKIYVDGLESGSFNLGNSGQKALIGAKWNSETQKAENHFNGWIEEVRIWNTSITVDQIRFMMNQRLYNNGTQMGVEIPMNVPDGLSFTDLAGYYQLLAQEELIVGGTTTDLAQTAVAGRLNNMETLQENTAPLPYTSRVDGQNWATKDTWTHFEVWDAPNSNGISGDPIDWNIVRTSHNITSGNKDITVLGLLSEDKELEVADPGDAMDEYNAGKLLRVTHYLKLNGIIDLAGESQLLQDEGSILEEASSGYLERDQQGTRNSFNYNYWSAPVSAQGSANNSPYTISTVLRDGTDSQNPRNIDFRWGHAAADQGRTSPIIISAYWLHGFNGRANQYGDWQHLGANGTLNTGEGFTMKGTSGTASLLDEQNYIFSGKPHNGNFTLSIGEDMNYLVGNPYPSALNTDEFILDNLRDIIGGRNSQNIFNGVIYFWDHFGAENTHVLREYVGGYAAYTLAGGVQAISNDYRINHNNAKGTKTPQQFIPVGQGFFLNTRLDEENSGNISITGGEIIFRNSQRQGVKESPGNSIFLQPISKGEKTNTPKVEERAKIRLKFHSPKGYHRQILVTRDINTSNEFDLGYDAPLIENNKEDMYWLIDSAKFVIQAVPDFEKEQVVPLGIKVAEEGYFKISIDSLENFPDEIPVYLNDKLLDSIHDLKERAYDAVSEPGEIHNRFELVFENIKEIPKIPEKPELSSAIDFSYNHNTRELRIDNPELIEISEVLVFDLGGKLIQTHTDIPLIKQNIITINPIGASVYIVKLITVQGNSNKKFIMK